MKLFVLCTAVLRTTLRRIATLVTTVLYTATPLSVVLRIMASLLVTSLLVVITSLLLVRSSYAAGSNMPWEGPLQSILDSIQGPVARIVAVIIIIMTGLALAFGDTSGGFRKLIQIVFGLSIAFAASSFFLTFFSFGGGALIATA